MSIDGSTGCAVAFAVTTATAGKHEGKLGYYDNEDERDKAIAYLEGSRLLSAEDLSDTFTVIVASKNKASRVPARSG